VRPSRFKGNVAPGIRTGEGGNDPADTTANDFKTSVTRAAYNQKWLSQATPGYDCDMIVFSWPARKCGFDNLTPSSTMSTTAAPRARPAST